jgi:hypothetical protein
MRIPIPENIAAEILFRHDHTCCICQERGRHVQIHHLDENPSNNDPSNLAVVCTECHNDTMMKGGFGRKLGASEVRIYRDDWIRRVADRRSQADQLALQKQIGLAVEKIGDVKEWRPPSDIALYTFVDSKARAESPQAIAAARPKRAAAAEQASPHLEPDEAQ